MFLTHFMLISQYNLYSKKDVKENKFKKHFSDLFPDPHGPKQNNTPFAFQIFNILLHLSQLRVIPSFSASPMFPTHNFKSFAIPVL